MSASALCGDWAQLPKLCLGEKSEHFSRLFVAALIALRCIDLPVDNSM